MQKVSKTSTQFEYLYSRTLLFKNMWCNLLLNSYICLYQICLSIFWLGKYASITINFHFFIMFYLNHLPLKKYVILWDVLKPIKNDKLILKYDYCFLLYLLTRCTSLEIILIDFELMTVKMSICKQYNLSGHGIPNLFLLVNLYSI